MINATNIAKLSPSFDGVELKVEYRHGEEQYGSVVIPYTKRQRNYTAKYINNFVVCLTFVGSLI